MATAIINLLAALFKAIPSIRSMVECACEASRSANVAEAISRWEQKNANVKKAIENANKKNEQKND